MSFQTTAENSQERCRCDNSSVTGKARSQTFDNSVRRTISDDDNSVGVRVLLFSYLIFHILEHKLSQNLAFY